MAISLTCFILGDTTDSIFTVRLSDLVIVDKTENTEIDISKLKISDLREYIWRKERLETRIDNHRSMNLWKVNVCKDELEGVSTEEEIRTKLEGKKMDTNKLFRNEEYFPADHSSDTIENIHIIVVIPTTGPSQQGAQQAILTYEDIINILDPFIDEPSNPLRESISKFETVKKRSSS